MEYDGFPFLSVPYNFGFILNIDWFQPYVHTQYSLGAIYLAVLNLSRSIRYLRENILLIGIIPGPKEPKKHVNTYLTPLVNDLKHLWNGVVMTNTKKELVIVKGALLCVACDLPAGRILHISITSVIIINLFFYRMVGLHYNLPCHGEAMLVSLYL